MYDSKNLELKTDRLILRGHRESDFPLYWEMLNDKIARKYTGGITQLDYKSRKELFLAQCHSFGKGDFEFAIELKEKHQYIGYCGFQYNDDEETMELLYGLLQNYWGYGYITEACRAVLAFGFSQLDLKSIVAFSYPENINSQNVLKKLGMLENGIIEHNNEITNKYILYRPEEVSM